MDAFGAILLMTFLFFLYDILPPFIIGVVIKGIFRRKNIPRYIPLILGALIGVVIFYINGKSPIRIFESNLIGLAVFILIYAIFIKAGIKAYSELTKGL